MGGGAEERGTSAGRPEGGAGRRGAALTARNLRRASGACAAPAVVGGDFVTVNLEELRGKYVVLVFYPLAFTFVCPTELWAFSERIKEFHDNNTEVLLISTDSKFSLLAWKQVPRERGGAEGLAVPLVSDLTHNISKSYGVLIEDGSGDTGAAFRGTFVIDDKGVVRASIVHDLPVGRSVDEVLRVVKAFQYTDKHGDVCPAGWTPGADTMKADPKLSLAYFAKHSTSSGAASGGGKH